MCLFFLFKEPRIKAIKIMNNRTVSSSTGLMDQIGHKNDLNANMQEFTNVVQENQLCLKGCLVHSLPHKSSLI
jgi:aromatic ring hydroxylase